MKKRDGKHEHNKVERIQSEGKPDIFSTNMNLTYFFSGSAVDSAGCFPFSEAL